MLLEDERVVFCSGIDVPRCTALYCRHYGREIAAFDIQTKVGEEPAGQLLATAERCTAVGARCCVHCSLALHPGRAAPPSMLCMTEPLHVCPLCSVLTSMARWALATL